MLDHQRYRNLSTLLGVLTVFIVGRASAQCDLGMLTAEVSGDAQMGFSVGIDGDFAVVGVPYDDDRGDNAGAVWIFRRSGSDWVPHRKITAVDAESFDAFGAAVAISGDYLAVGSPADDDRSLNSGAVYVFQRIGLNWAQQTKLTIMSGAEDDEFGHSLSIRDDVLASGARTDAAGGGSGSVYVYRRNSSNLWRSEGQLTASDASEGDQFGLSVGVRSDVLVVGARLEDAVAQNAGAAYVFRKGPISWLQEAKLTVANGQNGDEFGVSVAMDGDTVLIGSRLANVGQEVGAGAAYVFTRSNGTWAQRARLTAEDPDGGTQFGNSVALRNGVAAIGAWKDDLVGQATGAVYLFAGAGSDWTQKSKLSASFPDAQDELGFSVAVSATHALAGVPGDDGIGDRAGSAILFGVGGDCNGNGIADTCEIVAGSALDLNNDGVPDECTARGDADNDGDVDLVDVGRLQRCFSGPGVSAASGCTAFLVDADSDVDATDYAAIRLLMTGP